MKVYTWTFLILLWEPSHAFQPGHSAFDVPAMLSSARIVISSPLKYRDRDEDSDAFVSGLQKPKQSRNPNSLIHNTGVSLPIVRSLAMSQTAALVGNIVVAALAMAFSGHIIDLAEWHWNGSDDFFSPWDFTMTPIRVIEGILAATPMIFLENKVERSESRDCSQVNFSTRNMVMTLFGRRERPHAADLVDHPILQNETPMLHVLLLAAGLAMLTGISEELIFRGVLPTAIYHQTNSVAIAILGQAALFGLGHVSSQAKAGENKVVAGLQFANGYWHGLVYLATGGDVLPCIISHFIYDWHVFMETWMTTNAQMDYTNKATLTKLTTMEERELRKIKHEAGPSLSAETMAFARRFFYAFDYSHCGSLSKADVQRAVSYAFLHDERQPTEEQVNILFESVLDGRDAPECLLQDEIRSRLVLPEFLRLLFLLKARRMA